MIRADLMSNETLASAPDCAPPCLDSATDCAPPCLDNAPDCASPCLDSATDCAPPLTTFNNVEKDLSLGMSDFGGRQQAAPSSAVQLSTLAPSSASQLSTLATSDFNSSLPAAFRDAILVLLTGPSGTGKTNLALNLARSMRYLGGDDVKTDVALERQSQHPLDTQYLAGDGVKTGVAAVRKTNVTLVDLDVVNPYFRSGNSLDFLQKHDIRFLGPSHSSSNLDTPSLQPGIDAAIQDATYANRVVIDVGGDPDGARALARFVPRIHALAATGAKIVVVYVFNACRAMAIEQPENLDLLRGIEAVSGLKINALLNNTHLKEQTTEKILRDADEKAKCLVSATGIPLVATTVPAFLHASFKDNWPVDILVGTPWEFNLH